MIGENVLEGLPFSGVDIFDVHMHIDRSSDFEMPDTDPAEVVRTMDALGIAGGCASSVVSIHSDCARGNARMLEAVRAYPGRLYGYVVVSPHENGVDLDPYFAQEGVLGLKVHAAFHNASIGDPAYIPFWEYADRRSLPILFHAWELADVLAIAKLAAAYPAARFVIGHGIMRTREIKRAAIEAVRGAENIWADTTVSAAFDGAVEYAVSKIGADRLCYGSDLPFYDCRHVLGKVATARLTDAEKEKILGGNARALLRAPR